MPYAEIDKLSLYYEICGTGPPLVLIAGMTADSRSWHPLLDRFSSSFKTVVLDNRGSGRTRTPDTSFSIRQMADDTVRLLDILNIEQAHIIGHSMGGYIAQELAINYPGRVDKLVLASTAAATSERNKTLFHNMFEQGERGMDFELWFRNFLFWILTPERFDNTEFIGAVLHYAVDDPHPQSLAGLRRQIEAVNGHDTRMRLRNITAKTLVLVGEKDILARPGDVEMLCREIPGALPLKCLSGSAHAVHMENPGAFATTAMEFLS